MRRIPPKVLGGLMLLSLVVVAGWASQGALPAPGAQTPVPTAGGEAPASLVAVKNEGAPPAPKPPDPPKKSKLDKTRSEAAELSALADQLRDELNKMDVHVLSLDVLQKAEKVQKLARKIKAGTGEN